MDYNYQFHDQKINILRSCPANNMIKQVKLPLLTHVPG